MDTNELILHTLHQSSLTEELRDTEVEELAKIIELNEYKAGTYLLKPSESELRNTLIMLASGEVEASAIIGGEKASFLLLQPGDLAGIVTFVGGSVTQIGGTVMAKSDSKVLLLERSRLESLLSTNPALVYYVMRGVVRHVHGVTRRMMRRMNMQSVEMINYVYKQSGRY